MSTATLLEPEVETVAVLAPEPAPAPKPYSWGPGWDVCPWCNAARREEDRRPCGCGGEIFLVVANPASTQKCRHLCKKCYRNSALKLARSGDRVVGTQDCQTGVYTPL